MTVTNEGTTTVGISGLDIDGADFSYCNGCAWSVAAGTNRTITACFEPTKAGAGKATLKTIDSARGRPQEVARSGTEKGLSSLLFCRRAPR